MKKQIDAFGFALIPQGISEREVATLTTAIEQALHATTDDAVALRNRGGIYGARNILEICPSTALAWQTPSLLALLRESLGDEFGLVRGLYFDKPPERSWSLPWHQDLTIAVRQHRPSTRFLRPTIKAGVPHLEAPTEILSRMLTLRIHLDHVTPDNGPLQVLPGTHLVRADEIPIGEPTIILAQAGDVLAMRPLLAHCSGPSAPHCTTHRRILHLEFAADRELPDGLAWHTYLTRETTIGRSCHP